MKQFSSKVDMVYSALIDEIMSGAYLHGDRLVISQIAKKYNVSNIPVREALRRMSSEGYVEINANQGAVICGYDKKTISEVVQIKAVLEGYASRMSIDFIKEKDLQKLRKENDKFCQVYALDPQRAVKYNMQFHMAIYNYTHNQELINMIQALWRKWNMTRILLPVNLVSTQDSGSDHEHILELIAAKKYEETEQFVRTHKMRTGQELLSFLK